MILKSFSNLKHSMVPCFCKEMAWAECFAQDQVPTRGLRGQRARFHMDVNTEHSKNKVAQPEEQKDPERPQSS